MLTPVTQVMLSCSRQSYMGVVRGTWGVAQRKTHGVELRPGE